uniref:Uncharacterized protein n=1 Tax=Rhizophora mucronata TaxID=61149 RepID=A0A2P2QFC5_RHIMU
MDLHFDVRQNHARCTPQFMHIRFLAQDIQIILL